jgi:lipoprotein-anchoring transpeptidase ErfK/SrfK
MAVSLNTLRAGGAALLVLGLSIGGLATTSARATSFSPAAVTRTSYPRIGLITSSSLVARSGPARTGRVITVFRQFRADYLPTVLSVVAEQRGKAGILWLKVAVPGRPNGRYGWVSSQFVNSAPVYKRVIVDLSSRTLSLYDRSKLRFRTKVAIGTRSNPTPTGSFYVQARFRPTHRILGAFAFETSAYSPTLTDWPGGGVVGIHGWSDRSVFGKAVSHGCIRIPNSAALYLKKQVLAGTPVLIRQ